MIPPDLSYDVSVMVIIFFNIAKEPSQEKMRDCLSPHHAKGVVRDQRSDSFFHPPSPLKPGRLLACLGHGLGHGLPMRGTSGQGGGTGK